MVRYRKIFSVVSVAAFVASLLVLTPTPAQATHNVCGDVITESTTLEHDVLHCSAHGLIVAADDITVDLNGHTVSCANTYPEQVAILLADVSGVTVQNGTVENCDAGVSIEGGSNNTIREMTARNNVNDMEEPFDPMTMNGPLADIVCLYGDGILVLNSSNNVIEQNWVYKNGPYSGISLFSEGSDGNIVIDNNVYQNNLTNLRQQNPGQRSLCGASQVGTSLLDRGRAVQDIGIRIEGPGADQNLVDDNRVVNSALIGISIHSYICSPPGSSPPGAPNLNNHITRNKVRHTGSTISSSLEPVADGISSIAQGPIGTVTCTSPSNLIDFNRSRDNRRHGVSLATTVSGTTVGWNQANRNGMDGFNIAPGAIGNVLDGNRACNNPRYDGADHNGEPPSLPNIWLNNLFGLVWAGSASIDSGNPSNCTAVAPPLPGPKDLPATVDGIMRGTV